MWSLNGNLSCINKAIFWLPISAIFLNTDENGPTIENEFLDFSKLLTKKLDAVYVFANMKVQLASALPRFGGENVKSRQSKFLTAFLSSANISFSKNPIFCSRRRVSITRICERLARATRPFTNPTDILSLCSRGEVVSGMIIQALGPKPRTITPGRTYQSPFPSCSVPTLTPNRHH